MDTKPTKNNIFDQFVQHKALSFKFADGGLLVDLLIDADEDHQIAQLKNVCAKLPVRLVSRLDKTIRNLDCSKRQFIEFSIIEALNRAEEIVSDVDMFEFTQTQSDGDKK